MNSETKEKEGKERIPQNHQQMSSRNSWERRL